MTSARPSRPGPPIGLRRSLTLFRAFRVEKTDPERFYSVQAADTVAQLAEYVDVKGKVVLDVGGGAGWFTAALRQTGAACFLVEPDAGSREPDNAIDPWSPEHAEAVRPARLAHGSAVAGDGRWLPFRDGAADVVLSSNVLEHVADPGGFIDEAARVTKPGGVIYLSCPMWLSPWGGHETSPWHYLGGHRAARRYTRRHGRPPKNLYGTSMFARHAGSVLRLVKARRDVDLLAALPRYYPKWLWWLVEVPGLREVALWNLLVVLRRRPADTLPCRVPTRHQDEVGIHP